MTPWHRATSGDMTKMQAEGQKVPRSHFGGCQAWDWTLGERGPFYTHPTPALQPSEVTHRDGPSGPCTGMNPQGHTQGQTLRVTHKDGPSGPHTGTDPQGPCLPAHQPQGVQGPNPCPLGELSPWLTFLIKASDWITVPWGPRTGLQSLLHIVPSFPVNISPFHELINVLFPEAEKMMAFGPGWAQRVWFRAGCRQLHPWGLEGGGLRSGLGERGTGCHRARSRAPCRDTWPPPAP